MTAPCFVLSEGVEQKAIKAGCGREEAVWPLQMDSLATSTRRNILAGFPKVFRRLTSYFDGGGSGLAGFLPWLAKTKEQVLDLANGNFTHLDNVLAVKDGKIRLTLQPEQLVIVSAKTTNPAIAPWIAH